MPYDQNGQFIPDDGSDIGTWYPSGIGGTSTITSGAPQTSNVSTGQGGSTQGVTTVATNNGTVTSGGSTAPASSVTGQPFDNGAVAHEATPKVSTIPDAPATPPGAEATQPVSAPTPNAPTVPAAASILGQGALGNGIGGAVQQAAAQQPTSSGFKLAELQPANATQGNPYYAAYTNSGDLAAAIPATLTDQQRVRLVDPKTGQVMVEGAGAKGAQQIASLASAVSQDLGRKAAWKIEYETTPDTFISPGYDRADPKHDLLKTIIKIAAPLLASAIPGLGPALAGMLGVGGSGAALAAGLGGIAGDLVTGGNLKSALLSGATAGLGSSLGGGLSSALKGGSFAAGLEGTNPLGGLLHAGSSALGGAGSSAAQAAIDQAGMAGAGINSILAGSSQELGSGGLGSALGNVAGTVAPAVVNGAGNSALQSALQTILGGAGTAASGLTTGTGGGGAAPGDNSVDPVTVTAAQSGGFDPYALDFSALANMGVDVNALQQALAAGQPGADQAATDQAPPKKNLVQELTSPDNLKDIAGQTIGDTAATMGVYGLANKVWGGDTGGDPGGIPNIPADAWGGGNPADAGPAAAATPGVPAPQPAANVGAGAGAPKSGLSGFAGGALGQALGLANTGGGAGGAAPLAGAPDLNVQGSAAPDIYPWRRAEAA